MYHVLEISTCGERGKGAENQECPVSNTVTSMNFPFCFVPKFPPTDHYLERKNGLQNYQPFIRSIAIG